MMLVPMFSPTQRTKELSSCGSIRLHVKTKKSPSSEQRLRKTFGEFILGQETFQNVQLLCASTDDDNSFPLPFFPPVVSVFCSQPELHALFCCFQYSAQEPFLGALSRSFIKVQDWSVLLIYIVSTSRLKE